MALEKGPDGIFSVWCLLLNHEMNFEIYIVAVIWICPSLLTKQSQACTISKEAIAMIFIAKTLDAMKLFLDQVKIYGNKSSIF